MQSAPRLEAFRQTIYTNIPEETRFIQVSTIYMMLLHLAHSISFTHHIHTRISLHIVTITQKHTLCLNYLTEGKQGYVKSLFQAVVQIYEVRLGD